EHREATHGDQEARADAPSEQRLGRHGADEPRVRPDVPTRPAHVAHLAAERGSILELHETPKPHALALSDIGAQIEPRDDAQPRATKPELAAFWRRSFEAGRDTDLTVVKPAFRARRHRQKP